MNALTDSETLAVHAIPVPQVPAQPSQQILLVPLSRLRPSRRNVRKTAGPSIEALAAMIPEFATTSGTGRHLPFPPKTWYPATS